MWAERHDPRAPAAIAQALEAFRQSYGEAHPGTRRLQALSGGTRPSS